MNISAEFWYLLVGNDICMLIFASVYDMISAFFPPSPSVKETPVSHWKWVLTYCRHSDPWYKLFLAPLAPIYHFHACAGHLVLSLV